MKKQISLIKLFSVVMAFCFVAVTILPNSVISARASEYTDNYDNLSLEEKQALIEQKLKEVNERLNTLGEESDETEEYINTLDEKIKYLNTQLKLSENQIESSENKITALEEKYKDNEEQISTLSVEIEDLTQKSEELRKQFDETYTLYGQRLRALYISGETSVLTMLLTSPDLSTLITRYEMIKRVSQADTALLKSLEGEADELKNTAASLQSKQTALSDNQISLKNTKQTLSQTVEDLQTQQTSFKEKQVAYKSEKAESDNLLKQLHDKTKKYSEYRNQDQAELDAINAEIEEAAERFRKKMEEEEKRTTTTTTAPPAKTTVSDDKPDDETQAESKDETTKKTTTKKHTTTKKPSNKLSMTYPVPSQKTITTDYGSAGYEGHTGVDFACDTGARVVAAESGYVIISKDLKNANGSYRSYGRYIVIMHDKKNSSGNYVYTLYAHNSKRVVSEGDYVNKGQTIAYAGETGNASGPHCHFEVRTPSASYDDCVNPRNYLP